MALLADNPTERADQLLLLTERLTALIVKETQRIDAREPPLDGEEGEEKARLANAYRLELARIKQDRSLLDGAPPGLLTQLRAQTTKLQDALAEHEIALGAVKLIAEGLVQAMAEETARAAGGARLYGATGGLESAATVPVAVDRKA